MGLLDRPYSPTWVPNREVYRHTPDAIVYVNGQTSIDSCPTCNRRVELQKFIVSISVDTSTNPIATATLSLVVPKHAQEVFGSDGNWLLQPGLEIVILFRGYFASANLVENENPDEPLKDVSMYPYYQVFRGIVKDVSHEFSGGFYSASLSCADILHLWQHLYLSANGAVFGPRPDNSGVFVDLEGHSLMRLSPFAIIYTLCRAGFGAAFGVEYKLSQKTNFKDARGNLFKHAAEYQSVIQQRGLGHLRMYGVDGNLFTMFDQAYLGIFQSGDQNKVTRIIKNIGGKINSTTRNPENTARFQETMRDLGFHRSDTVASITANSNGKLTAINMLAMQVYANDLGTMAQVNFFNSEMMSKLEIANAVISLTGYEFYQDVDGDLVFKPPFYNLDTSQDAVYVIEDRDLISISESSTEPEATMIKGTGTHYGWKGTGTDEWMGVGSTYIDFRLVAQYGWREGGSFETTYLTDPRSIFIAAINRLDLANIGVNSAEITIPLRPEMRPGYPVYISHLDCFYYAKSISHSFSFGGDCTTRISGVARRRKWLPPVEASKEGLPKLRDIRLDAPGQLPAKPIFVRPENVQGNENASGPLRVIGFPNVIMALDSSRLDITSVPLQSLTDSAVDVVVNANPGVFQITDNGDYLLRSGSGVGGGQVFSKEDLLTQFSLIRQELVQPSVITQQKKNAKTKAATGLARFNVDLVRAFQNSPLGATTAIRNEQALSNWISLNVNLRSLFAPGNEIRGEYRYYSSSHEFWEFQGPKTVTFTDDGIQKSDALGNGPNDTVKSRKVPTLVEANDGVGLVMREPQKGVKIAMFADTAGATFFDVQTGDVNQVSFAPHFNNQSTTREVIENGDLYAVGLVIDATALAKATATRLVEYAADIQPNTVIKALFNDGWEFINSAFDAMYAAFIEQIPDTAQIQITGPVGTPLAGQSSTPYSQMKTALASLDRMLAANSINGAYPVTKTYKSDAKGRQAIAEKLAMPWAKVVSQFTVATKNLFADGPNQVIANANVIEALMGAKSEFEAFMEVPSRTPSQNAVKKTVKQASSKKVYAPVFPVSDKHGYEVYGGMPYGRDMTVTDQYTVFDGLFAIANPESLQRTENALVAIRNNGVEAVTAFKGLKASEKAALAAAGVESGGKLKIIIDRTRLARGQVLARNKPITTEDLYQSETGAGAVAGLATLTVDNQGACACKGADAAFLMEISVEGAFGDVGIVTAVQKQILETGVLWKQSKDALAGVAGDSAPNYGAQFDRIKSAVGAAKTGVDQVTDRASDALKRLKDKL
jgi:hypothetical protein